MTTYRPAGAQARRILVVDNDAAILECIRYALEAHGFRVHTAADGDTALRVARERPPDLVLLDLIFPTGSGFDIFRDLRAARPGVPVIMVTSRNEEVDRVLGLELGADDYVTKPFATRELVARVNAVLRRARGGAEAPPKSWRHGPLAIDVEAFRLECDGRPLDLTRGEFRFLECLLRHPARVFTREAMMERLYDDDRIVADRSIDAYVRRLRRKFEDVRPGLDPIETVHGVGYKLRHGLEDES